LGLGDGGRADLQQGRHGLVWDAGTEDLQVLTHRCLLSSGAAWVAVQMLRDHQHADCDRNSGSTLAAAHGRATLVPIVAHLAVPTDPTRLPA
jgi:hypothetical protein